MNETKQESPVSLIETAIDLSNPPEISLSDDELSRIVVVSRQVTVIDCKRKGIPCDETPWHDLPERRRHAMREGVRRLLQSMILLGWIDVPR